ncbi:hypothetical protein [Sphingobium terrigena]|uniref:hypothetical protein n=1 Tax=Sphingobium terrigena TaxID=2304063 RepID=UPI000E6CF2D8|nr:hypothetical protein [Sphingobium terrigena]
MKGVGCGRYRRPRTPEKAPRFLRAAAARWRGWRPVSVALVRSAVLPSSTRNPARGATGEEPMTTTIILLTINSIAQLMAAVAQLVTALDRRR